MSSSLDYQTTLGAVTRLAVPAPGDWCFVDLLESGRTRRAAVTHADPSQAILAERLERIFEPFFQVRQAERRRQRGTGLGLAICRQIVTLHGGRIWAESAGAGRGTTFTVRLPRAAERGRAA